MQQNAFIKNQWLELLKNTSGNKYLHISFDFWNTIAFSNHEFKIQRVNFIHDFLEKKFEIEKIEEAFYFVGKKNNSSTDNLEKPLTVDELYKSVLDYIGASREVEIEKMKSVIFDLFLKYPPSISENFMYFLKQIENNRVSLSITSNTAFIPGFVIKKFLQNEGLLSQFSFCVFSDEVQVAKPDKKIFDIVLSQLDSKIDPMLDVIHIGDNYHADYLGAKNFEMSAFFIENEKSIVNTRNALHLIYDIDDVPFSGSDYSKFKFGDSQVADRYGKELFEYFKNTHLPSLLGNYRRILIYSSPYYQIPTSSYYLTQSFFLKLYDHLNNLQVDEVSLKFCKIKRCQTYTEDYGALNAEERYNLIKNDTYQFVDIPSINDICIFIDDISITGTHQRVIEKLMEDSGIITNSIFLYYAKLSNPDVCPSFENLLNYSYTSDVTKLIDVILSDFYKITTRTTKYILSLKTIDLEFLITEIGRRQRAYIIKELIDMAESNDYDKIGLYNQNLETLKLRFQTLKV